MHLCVCVCVCVVFVCVVCVCVVRVVFDVWVCVTVGVSEYIYTQHQMIILLYYLLYRLSYISHTLTRHTETGACIRLS